MSPVQSVAHDGTLLGRFGDILGELSKGTHIEVTWNSTRSNEEQSAEGRVSDLHLGKSGGQSLFFIRPDGQTMVVKEDLKIYSPGSNFPLTGDVTDIEVQEEL